MSETLTPVKSSALPLYTGDLENVFAMGYRVDITPNASVRFKLPNPRTLNSTNSNSLNYIVHDVAAQIQCDANNGTTDVSISFVNLPFVNCESLLIINSSRASAFNVALPTGIMISGAITYTFKSLIGTTMAIAANGTAEIDFLFIFIDSTHCVIRMTGGVGI